MILSPYESDHSATQAMPVDKLLRVAGAAHRYHLAGVIPCGPVVPVTWTNRDLHWPWRVLGWHR